MTRTEIEEWVLDWVGDRLGMSPDDLDHERTFASYGFEQLDLEVLGDEIEDFFEEPLEPKMLTRRSNVARLTRSICILMDTDEGDDDETFEMTRDVEMGEVMRELGVSGFA